MYIYRTIVAGLFSILSSLGLYVAGDADGVQIKSAAPQIYANAPFKLPQSVMKEIRKLFPTRHIPEPILFKIYPWTEGCTYWLTGTYNPIEMSKNAHTIKPGLYCCGESISLRQAWMEGALESAEEVCKLL